jgi:hypothetical protein
LGFLLILAINNTLPIMIPKQSRAKRLPMARPLAVRPLLATQMDELMKKSEEMSTTRERTTVAMTFID